MGWLDSITEGRLSCGGPKGWPEAAAWAAAAAAAAWAAAAAATWACVTPFVAPVELLSCGLPGIIWIWGLTLSDCCCRICCWCCCECCGCWCKGCCCCCCWCNWLAVVNSMEAAAAEFGGGKCWCIMDTCCGGIWAKCCCWECAKTRGADMYSEPLMCLKCGCICCWICSKASFESGSGWSLSVKSQRQTRKELNQCIYFLLPSETYPNIRWWLLRPSPVLLPSCWACNLWSSNVSWDLKHWCISYHNLDTRRVGHWYANVCATSNVQTA